MSLEYFTGSDSIGLFKEAINELSISEGIQNGILKYKVENEEQSNWINRLKADGRYILSTICKLLSFYRPFIF
jgi:hypothetical protein